MSKQYIYQYTTAALALATLLLSSCSSGTGKVSFKSGGMTHTFSEGQASVPTDFPLPVYPTATVTGSVSAEGGSDDEHSRFLMLTSKDTVEKVRKYYIEQLKAGNWQLGSEQSSGSLINLTATQKDLEANVMVSGDGQKTTISLSVNKATNSTPVPDSSNYQPNKVTPPTD